MGGTTRERKKDVQDKSNDFNHAVTGFIFSFVFFCVIFIIGIVIQQLTS